MTEQWKWWLCVYKVIGKINISNTLFKTTKYTAVYTCWRGILHTNNSFGKKPVACNVVAMWFKQSVSMSSGFDNMTKFKNIWEVDGYHAENNLATKY